MAAPALVWLGWQSTWWASRGAVLAPAWVLGLALLAVLGLAAMALVLAGGSALRWASQTGWAKRAASRLGWLCEAGRCLARQPARWLLLTLAAWAAQGLAVALLCRAAGLDVPAWLAAGFYALAMVGGALSALPAGLGGTEALLVALLVGQGAAAGTAVAVMVLARLLTLWLAVALGLLALLYSAGISKDIRFR
jgi:uncharacterized membrane protein YbhN (UPF0104 family)